MMNDEYPHWYDDINETSFVLIPFPVGSRINETVTVKSDGTYTVFINSNICPEKRLKALKHALKQLSRGDFEKCDVQDIEGNM